MLISKEKAARHYWRTMREYNLLKRAKLSELEGTASAEREAARTTAAELEAARAKLADLEALRAKLGELEALRANLGELDTTRSKLRELEAALESEQRAGAAREAKLREAETKVFGRDTELGALRHELDYFAACVREGRRPEIVTPEEAARAVMVMETAERSAKEGMPLEYHDEF